MAKQPQVAVKLSALDDYSAAFTGFQKHLMDTRRQIDAIQGPMAKFNQQQQEQASSVYGYIRAGAGRMQAAMGAVSRGIPGMGALAGLGSVAGIGMAVKDFSQFGTTLENASKQAGMTADGLNSMRGAARMAGLDASTADSAMIGLNQALQGAAFGTNSNAAKYFKLLGIDFGNARDGAKSLESVLPALQNALKKAYGNNPSGAIALGNILNLSPDAVALLAKGADEMDRLRRTSAAINPMTPATIQAAKDYAESIGKISTAAEGLRNAMVSKVEPAITPVIKGLTEMVTGVENTVSAIDRLKAVYAGLNLDRIPLFSDWLANSQKQTMDRFSPMQTAREGAGRYDEGVFGKLDPLQKQLYQFDSDARTRFNRQYAPERFPAAAPPSPPNGTMAPGPRFGVPGGGAPFGPQGNQAEPRGIRNNNSTNLSYVPGQEGVVGSDGRFGIYADMEGGIAAAHRQLQKYQSRGLMSVGAMIGKWAPPNENDTARYVSTVAGRMGIDPSAPVNLRDPEQASKMIGAMSRVETGRELDPAVVRRGVDRALGVATRPTSAPPPEQPDLTRGGRVNAPLNINQPPAAPAAPSVVRIDLNHTNAPDGTMLSANVQGGGAEMGNVRVRRAMPEQGWAGGY